MDQLLRRRDVERICAISRATLYRYIKKNVFPRPIRIGSGSVRWRLSDVVKWMEDASDLLSSLKGEIFTFIKKEYIYNDYDYDGYDQGEAA